MNTSDTQLSDRRYYPRVLLNLPCNIDWIENHQGIPCTARGTLVSISTRGSTIQMDSSTTPPDRFRIQFQFPNEKSVFSAECHVLWISSSHPGPALERGIRFINLGSLEESLLRKYISMQHRDKIIDRRAAKQTSSTSFEYRNKDGLKIAGFVDTPTNMPSARVSTVFIISPAYGETKTDSLLLSYSLIANGYVVIRYDATRHVGESDEGILDTSLTYLMDDLACVVQFAQKQFPQSGIHSVVFGILTPVVLRMSMKNHTIQKIYAVCPCFDLRAKVRETYGDDILENSYSPNDIVEFLGYPVRARLFFEDIMHFVSTDKETAFQELTRIGEPIHLLGSKMEVIAASGIGRRGKHDRDPDFRISMHEITTLTGQERGFSMVSVPAMHEIADVICKVNGISQCTQHSNLRDVISERAYEREMMRNRTLVAQPMPSLDFWGRYLEQFHFIVQVPDFRNFYQDMTDLLGTIRPGDRILDAGCGNGSFGAWLLSQEFENLKPMKSPALYMGLDIVPAALQMAIKSHQAILNKLLAAGKTRFFVFDYLCGDLSSRLPIVDGYFDHICCNLVLNYLPDPQASLLELYRMLKPGGTIVVSSIRPNPDFSEIYRKTVQMCVTVEQRQEARRLLNNVSDILDKEKHGIFRFFDQKDLDSLTDRLAYTERRFKPSFSNQACIVMVRK